MYSLLTIYHPNLSFQCKSKLGISIAAYTVREIRWIAKVMDKDISEVMANPTSLLALAQLEDSTGVKSRALCTIYFTVCTMQLTMKPAMQATVKEIPHLSIMVVCSHDAVCFWAFHQPQ